MTFCDFQTTTYGKWILAGEHAVVRGHEALVFPVKEKQFTLSYRATDEAPLASYSGVEGGDMKLLFWSVLERGAQMLNRSLTEVRGQFYIDSNIPVGVGMGASAALCVAISRWFSAQHWLEQHELHEFARQLENLFHGKSSGLDIAGVAAEQGVFFKQGQTIPLHLNISPMWYLSSCNQIGLTSHCIQQVQALWERSPYLAQQIDLQMIEAVHDCKKALEEGSVDSIDELAQGINKAALCFFQWGLVSESLQQHMSLLQNLGALAVKPTGSGGGGYVLSLWQNPPQASDIDFIKL